jgi:hypothetical protein
MRRAEIIFTIFTHFTRLKFYFEFYITDEHFPYPSPFSETIFEHSYQSRYCPENPGLKMIESRTVVRYWWTPYAAYKFGFVRNSVNSSLLHSVTPSLCHSVGAVTRERRMIESSKLHQMIATMLKNIVEMFKSILKSFSCSLKYFHFNWLFWYSTILFNKSLSEIFPVFIIHFSFLWYFHMVIKLNQIIYQTL